MSDVKIEKVFILEVCLAQKYIISNKS